ncbi:MAG: hypothetical protein R3C03_18580 [Pirellulaceae bacterium]
MSISIRLLNGREVAASLSMSRAIELMKEAFVGLSHGDIDVPQRVHLTNPAGTMLYKPAFMPSRRAMALKAVSVFPGNFERNLPVTTGVLLVNDSETGVPIGLMDAEYLTGLRTGAAAGLATGLLADPETEVAALFGTGGQAPFQLAALMEVLPLKRIYVFSKRAERADAFCETEQAQWPGVELVAGTSVDVLRECGVISTATTSHTPLFSASDVTAGAHINAVGSFRRVMCEIDPALVAASRVVVDQREAAMMEAGELVAARDAGLLPMGFEIEELGELIATSPCVRMNGKTTLFKSVGNAAQDIVMRLKSCRLPNEKTSARCLNFRLPIVLPAFDLSHRLTLARVWIFAAECRRKSLKARFLNL